MEKNNKLSKALMTRRFDTVFENLNPSEIPIHFICLIKVFIKDGDIIDLRPDQFHEDVRETLLRELDQDQIIEDIKVMIDIDKLAWHVEISLDQLFSAVFPE